MTQACGNKYFSHTYKTLFQSNMLNNSLRKSFIYFRSQLEDLLKDGMEQ